MPLVGRIVQARHSVLSPFINKGYIKSHKLWGVEGAVVVVVVGGCYGL